MQATITIVLLVFSNIFMTLAWYAHLHMKMFNKAGLIGVSMAIIFSWLIAFFEYSLQVPANRIGSDTHGGPFNLFQLKLIQEVITLVVFSLIAILVFKTQKPNANQLIAFLFLIGATYFMFRK